MELSEQQEVNSVENEGRREEDELREPEDASHGKHWDWLTLPW